MNRLLAGLKSPWALGFSGFGLCYGVYNIVDMSASGEKYELDQDLSGKTYIVTGANSGIGRQTSEELARRKATVIMACRSRERCVEARREIVLSTHNRQVYCRQCDLEDFDSIRSFVAKLSEGKLALNRIDGVVHNAAILNSERATNKDGIERSLAVNHLGTFLLTGLMLDKLLTQGHPARLVYLNTNVISRKCQLDLSNLNMESVKGGDKWDGFEAYKRSKLAEALFVKELADRLKDTNVSVVMADPGRTKSALTRHQDSQQFFLSRWLVNFVGFFMGERKVEKAIRPVLYAIADPASQKDNGVFYDRERRLQDWGEEVENASKRAQLWSISSAWSRLEDQLRLLKGETSALVTAAAAAGTTEGGENSSSSQSSTRSWRTLWLW